MTERTTSPDLGALLGHTRWLRRLAGHLVNGSDGADDAVQDTFVAALRARPSSTEDLRPWLARVLRNALIRRARTEGRRRAREQSAVAAEEVHGPASSLERFHLQRQLTELVTALDEPFRTTVVMRYFEEKSAAEIARALGIPEGTVRWRTKEALDRLRAQLDERHRGDRKAWSAVLAPLALRRSARMVAVAGAAGAVMVGIAAVVVAANTGSGRAPGEGGASPWRLPRFSASASNSPPRPAPEAVLDGVVQGPDGKPVAGAVVTARAVKTWRPGGMSFGTERPLPAAVTVSDPMGGFHLTVPGGRYVVAAADSRYGAAYQRDVEAPHVGRLQIRLGAGGFVLSGQVLDQGGGPIPGAQVMAQGRWLAMFAAVASAQGEYKMVLPEGVSELVVVANGYGPLRLNARIEADERRILRLAPAARVSGRVVANGRAIAGATVRLIPVDAGPRDRWEEEASTDGAGRFVFSDLPAFDFRPFVRHGSLVTRTRGLVSLSAGAQETLELVLEPGVTVRGRVHDGAGRPVKDAGVGLTEARAGGVRVAAASLAEVAAGEDGRFVLEGVPPGSIDLHPAAPGYSPHSRTMDIGAQPVVDVDLVLDAASGVTGLVVRADGSPAAGAEVRGMSRMAIERRSNMSLGRADAAGRFEVLGLAAGDVTLTSWLGREAALVGPFPLATGERKEVTIQLEPGAFLSGTVRWDDGRPAMGVKVTGRGERANPQPGEPIGYQLMIDPVRTDPEGRYTIGPFLPGRARTAAFAPGEREAGTSAPRPNQGLVMVDKGQQIAGVDLMISSGSQQVGGMAVDGAGHPLPGATLIAVQELPGQAPYPRDVQAHQAISGGDGRFAIDRLARGTFTIFGQHPDHPDVTVSGVQAGATDATVRFPRPGRLTGVVVTGKGRPIKEYFVAAAPVVAPEKRSSDYPRLEVNDPKGAFSLTRLAPGSYDVTVLVPGHMVARLSGVTLAEGETKRLRLVAEPGATLVGRVVDDATGAPAMGVKVMVLLPGQKTSEAVTDHRGAFELRGVIRGDRIRVHAVPDGSPKRGQVIVAVPALGTTVDAGTIRLADLQRQAASMRSNSPTDQAWKGQPPGR